MLRVLGSVVLGYLVIALSVMVSLTLMWLALGSEFAYGPEGHEVTFTWALLTLMESFFGAVLGGWVAANVARQSARNAVRGLAGLVLILGIASGIFQLQASSVSQETEQVEAAAEIQDPTTEVRFFEAGRRAQQPVWYLLALPWVGAMGVAFGGAIYTRKIP